MTRGEVRNQSELSTKKTRPAVASEPWFHQPATPKRLLRSVKCSMRRTL